MEFKIYKISEKIKRLIVLFYRSKLVRFGFVGFLGTLTNLLIFFIFVDVIKFPDLVIQIAAFIIAVTQNYLLNSLFTFKESADSGSKNGLLRYLKFVGTSITGLLINLLVYWIIVHFFNPELKVIVQAIGILSGMLANFIGSKYLVFTKQKELN
jgi:putative flippase GtrA